MSRPNTNTHQFVFTLPRFYAGKIFFVDSTYGSNAYEGDKPNQPLQSITYALTKCVDDRDDLIICLDGYNNTVTDALTNGDDTPIVVDKNGVTILAAGRNCVVRGITADDSIFKIDANQVTIGRLNEQCGFAVAAAEAGTAGTVVEIAAAAVDAEVFGFRTQSCDGYDELITISATSHRAWIHHNHFIGDTTDTDEGIMIEGTVAGVIIEDNILALCCTGNGAIYSASVHTNCLVRRNLIDSRTASKLGINFTANATGIICDNRVYVAADASGIVNGQCAEFENYVNDAFTTSGFISPAAGSIT